MDDVDVLIEKLAGQLLQDVEPLALAVADAISGRVGELAGDQVVAQELVASTRANILRFLRAAAGDRDAMAALSAGAPPEALDLARMFVRRGIDLEVLANTYRWGQNAAWREWMGHAAAHAPAAQLPAVLERSSARMFAYVDAVLEAMGEQVEHERRRLHGGTAARREQTVRLLLDGAPVDPAGAGRLLGYDLALTHTAFVAWVDPGTDAAHGDLERVAAAVARACAGRADGTPRGSLTIAPGRASIWGWVATAAPPDLSAVERTAREAGPGPRVAVGGTHAGIDGFCRGHEEAVETQALLLTGDPHRRFLAHRAVDVVLLMAGDRERLRRFVVETLGPLGAGGRGTADLLETVRIYLDEGDHTARTAARLGTHRNTVLARLARAEQILGHPLGTRRLALATALEAERHLGFLARGPERPAAENP